MGAGVAASVNLVDASSASVSSPYSGVEVLPGPFKQTFTQLKADYGTPIIFQPQGRGPLNFYLSVPDGTAAAAVQAIYAGSVDGLLFFETTFGLGAVGGPGPAIAETLGPPNGVYCPVPPPFVKITLGNVGDMSETSTTVTAYQAF